MRKCLPGCHELSKTIHARIDDSLYQALRDEADSRNLELNDIIRERLGAASKGSKTPELDLHEWDDLIKEKKVEKMSQEIAKLKLQVEELRVKNAKVRAALPVSVKSQLAHEDGSDEIPNWCGNCKVNVDPSEIEVHKAAGCGPYLRWEVSLAR